MENEDALFAWPEEGVSRVPYRVYSDPDIHQAEQTRIFRGATWNFLGMEWEIPEPGDYKTVNMGDTPIVVVRDENGEINALVNRCAHRGNLVCVARHGKAAFLDLRIVTCLQRGAIRLLRVSWLLAQPRAE